MKLGRNDPCHCGSGKKYKKCCLPKDEEADHQVRIAAQSAPPSPPPPPLPHVELPPPDPEIVARNAALDARWEEFEQQDYEGQIAVFLTTLDEKGLMDDQLAFDMLDALYLKSAERNDQERYMALLDAFHERFPTEYEENAQFYLHRQIDYALATDHSETLSRFVQPLAKIAGKAIDTVSRVVDTLAYHGQLSSLIELSHTAWPHVRRSRDVLQWAIHDFSQRAQHYVIFGYLEHTSTPNLTDPELRHQLEFYGAVDREKVERYCARLTGQHEHAWTLADFQFKPLPSRSHDSFGDDDDDDDDDDTESESNADYPKDIGRQNLLDLSTEFFGYLRREEGMSYSKAELGGAEIVRYLFDRFDGRLKPNEDIFSATTRKKSKSKAVRQGPVHVLCPDHDTLDRYLGVLINILSYQPHKAAATLEVIPGWLRFLETQHLVDAQQRHKTLATLHDLAAVLLKVLDEPTADPALIKNLHGWRENVERELPT